MIDQSFLGISQTQWELINSFAPWLSALGTLLAVVVSLYLASNRMKPKAKTWIGLRVIITPGTPGPHPEYIVFHIVNLGDRILRITNIGWEVRFPKKRYAIQNADNNMIGSYSSPLPVELNHGQEASWYIPLDARNEPWFNYFAKSMLMPNYRLSCYSLKGQFFTSLGHTFETKPEPEFLEKLKKACVSIDKEVKSQKIGG